MPAKPDKTYRIRVRTLDGQPRDQGAINKLKSNQLGMPHLDIVGSSVANEFIICASKDGHIDQVRAKLGGAGLAEVAGGDTTIAASAAPTQPNAQPPRRDGFHQRSSQPQRGGHSQRDGVQLRPQGRPASATNAQPLPGKPYGFVAVPTNLTCAPPVWHDGTSSKGRLSGEIRFELETLTPLLVGWERGQMGDAESDWPLENLAGVGQVAARKSVLCPLRAPWGNRPVIIPGDTLKGLLRHELGALLGAPMERVTERSYSYRPNSLFTNQPNPRLIARLARVSNDGVEMKALDRDHQIRVPSKLGLLPTNLEYNKKANKFDFLFDQNGGAAYRGGQGAGQMLNSKRPLHHSLKVLRDVEIETVDVPMAAQEGYLSTLRHLVDLHYGHFSERHPDVPKNLRVGDANERILEAAKTVVFQPGDLVWVEWDTDKKCIVSLGWHYYYRWAYADSIRGCHQGIRARKEGGYERHGLFPLEEERVHDADGAPKGLSPVRRLFGYTVDNDGSAGIGEKDYAQLMGRVSVNAALEVVGESDTDLQRFQSETFLKELGMPRPSAVEHYLQQPHHPIARPFDRATLMTYGDAAGYDTPGELAGRKFYLDRKDAYPPHTTKDGKPPWEDPAQENRTNERSTLAMEASKPWRKFRFTVRFRDLDATELAAILVAFCPHQFRTVLGGTHPDGYCSKLGYARPLGWGSLRIEAKSLLHLDDVSGNPALTPDADLEAWVKENYKNVVTQDAWLDVHRHKHPDATDYPKGKDGQIYTFHTSLRAEHSRNRRYRNGGPR